VTLTKEQIGHFIDRGYVRLPGAIPVGVISGWRDRARQRLLEAPERFVKEYPEARVQSALARFRPEEPSTWPVGRLTVKSSGVPMVLEETAPSLWRALVQLVGDPRRFAEPRWSDEVILDFRVPDHAVAPEADDVTDLSQLAFHVDDPVEAAYLQGYPIGLVMLVLLEDVAPGEGATVLALDAIGPLARAIFEAPGQVNLQGHDALSGVPLTDFIEATGRAGDVYITHGLVAHAAGPARLRADSGAPWLRQLANPVMALRGGLRFGKATLGEGVAPVDQAVLRAIGSDYAGLLASAEATPAQTDLPRSQPRRKPRKKWVEKERPVPVPGWLAGALTEAGLGQAQSLTTARSQLQLTLGGGSGPALRLLLDPPGTGSPHRLPFESDYVRMAYAGKDAGPDAMALCERLGRVLEPHRDGLAKLFRDAASDVRTPPRWNALQPSEQNAMSALLAQLADDRPDTFLAAARNVQKPGPLLTTLRAWLEGRRRDARTGLETLATIARRMPELLSTTQGLTRVMGAEDQALELALARAEGAAGAARANGSLDAVEVLRSARAEPDWRQRAGMLLEEALAEVGASVQHQVVIARHAVQAGCLALARVALEAASGDASVPEPHLELARLALWRGDVGAARYAARRAEACGEALSHEHLAWRDLVLAGCEVLSGDPAAAVGPLQRLLETHPEPWTVATWLCRARSALGRHAEAEKADESAQAARHTLASAIVGTTNRARWVIAGGGRDAEATWDEAGIDPDGLLYGRLDWLSENRLAEARRSLPDALRLLEELQKCVGGNLSGTPTRVDADGTLVPIDDPMSPRQGSARLLHTLGREGFGPTLDALDRQVQRWAWSPQPHCYRGELLLWWDHLDDADASFEGSIDRGGTRWAYIGKGAVATLQGRDADALAHFDRCIALFGDLPGATLVVYRGELHRRAGRLAAASSDLDAAVRARSGRVGAWANLALLHLAEGDEDAARAALVQVSRRVPQLLYEAALEEGVPEGPLRTDDLPAVLERALSMMGGNRSSAVWTYRSRDGAYRVLPNPAPLCDWVRRNLAMTQLLAAQE